MIRRLAALAAAIGALAFAAPAAGYGTSTALVGSAAVSGAGTWTDAPAGAASAGGGVATLTETNVLGPLTFPSNQTFSGSAAGWSESGSLDNAYDGGTGNPAGSIKSGVSGLLLASGNGTWSSPTFSWSGANPLSASLSIDRRVTHSLLGSGSWRLTLKDLTTPALDKVLFSSSITSASAFQTFTTALAPADLQNGHTYRLDIRTDLAVPLLGSATVYYDNVVLTTQPVNRRAVGEMTVPSVALGSTMTLAVDAGGTGEAFDVQVWNGSAWNTRATIPAGAVAPVTYGLLPSERVGGEVRIRFVDQVQTADGAASSLSVDHVRVISTGGITVSGPATATLPAVTLDGLVAKVASGPFGAIDVTDGGGVASGWSLTATATQWARVGEPSETLPAGSFTAAPQAPTAPLGDSLTGVTAGAGGVFAPAGPIVLMTAAPSAGVGTFRQNPSVSLTVPPNADAGIYRSTVTLTAM